MPACQSCSTIAAAPGLSGRCFPTNARIEAEVAQQILQFAAPVDIPDRRNDHGATTAWRDPQVGRLQTITGCQSHSSARRSITRTMSGNHGPSDAQEEGSERSGRLRRRSRGLGQHGACLGPPVHADPAILGDAKTGLRDRKKRGHQIAAVRGRPQLAVLIWHMLTKQEDYLWVSPALVAAKQRQPALKAGAPQRTRWWPSRLSLRLPCQGIGHPGDGCGRAC